MDEKSLKHGGKTAKEKLTNKHLQYGDIWDCPHAGLLISARMLDKTRRTVQLEYLHQVLKDFGDIKEVKDRIGNLETVEEDTIDDLENYIKHYKRRDKNGSIKEL